MFKKKNLDNKFNLKLFNYRNIYLGNIYKIQLYYEI